MPNEKNYNESQGGINKPPSTALEKLPENKEECPASNQELLEEVRNNTTLIKVLSQDLVIISVDKIRIAYSQHMDARNTRGGWIAPVGLFSTLLLSLLTTTFTTTFGVDGATWKAFFLFACLVTAIWAATAIIQALKKKPIDDVESFIEKITVDKNNR